MLETKYIDLSVSIEKGIKEGLWKERLPSVRQMSKDLNADPATVSKAFKLLSEKGLVTIQGNKGTFVTQPGKGVKHKVIGIVGMSIDLPECSVEFSIMEKTAEAKKYKVVGIAYRNDLFVNDLDLLLKFPIDGYIFMYSRLTFEIAAFLRQNGIPFVSCNRPVGIPGVNWVDFDSEGSLEKALRYLIEQGHKRIGYIEFHRSHYRYSDRMLETYKKVLSERGFPFDKSLFLSEKHNATGDNYFKEYGIRCADSIMKLKEKPSAVLINNLSMAYGFNEELKKFKLNVPKDISVIAYNSQYIKDDFFTTLFNDYTQRSETAVKMLMDLIDNPGMDAEQKLLEGKIIIRKSTSEKK